MDSMYSSITDFLWLALALLVVGSVYLIVEGARVHSLFADSIVGRLVKTLVIVLLIELYSLGIVCFAYITFYPKGVVVLLPIVLLWLISLIYAIFAIRDAKQEVTKLMK